MPAVTGATLLTLLNNPSDLSDANAESIIDQAIDLVNLYANQSIDNIAAGTVTLSSQQRGVVLSVATAWYYYGFKGQIAASAAGVGITPTDPMSSAHIRSLLRRASIQLRTRTIKVS